ncbi:MAG: hypothetical protein JRG95_18470, partial [Deltaproteobacteria bacterium]|nr:hypothetical protein [Deltaproteobacteria bacterium]
MWLPGPTRLVWAWFAALFALGTPAWGQAVNIDNLNGELELGVLIRRQTSNTTGRPERRFDENRFDEAIGIDFDGYSLSPKVLRFSLGGRFGLQQADRESNLGDLSSGDSNILEYDANLHFFPTSPVSLLLFANRFQDRLNQSFGTDTESSGQILGSTLHFGAPFFPSVLTWRELSSEVESIGAAFPSRRFETRQLIEYSGQRFTNRSQVLLRLREEEVTDDSFPPVPDYRIREATGMFGRRFGVYLEK